MKKITLFILAVLVFLKPVFASERLVCVGFEEGSSWNYSNYFNLYADDLSDEWDIVSTSPRSGIYCARSKVPGDGWIEDSVFHYGRDIGWGGEIFLKWWAKYPADFDPRGTSTSDESHNFIRIGHGAGGNWTPDGAEFCNGFVGYFSAWYFPYNDSVLRPGTNYQTDNQWHEFAIYMKMPTDADTENGIIRIWQDANGDYSTENADYSNTSVDINTPWNHWLFGLYYKGAPKGEYTFYMDDIEIWDGMPEAVEEPAKSISGCGLSGCSLGRN